MYILQHAFSSTAAPAPRCPPPPAGLVNVRKNVGGGSFLAGYKRHFADYSSLEVRTAARRSVACRQASQGCAAMQHAVPAVRIP